MARFREVARLAAACSLIIAAIGAGAAAPDLSGYQPQLGLTAAAKGDNVVVNWTGAEDLPLEIEFGIEGGAPAIRSIRYRRGDAWTTLARNLKPEHHIDKGKRRAGGAGADPEARLDAYWDAPLNVPGDASGNEELPRRPEEIGRYDARFHAEQIRVKTDGARIELTFPGTEIGIFSGEFRWTVYRGTNLIRQEVIAKTAEDRVAYIYRSGLTGFSREDFARAEWRDVGGREQHTNFGGDPNQAPMAMRAQNRTAVVSGPRGSIAVFPPPHLFFFARQLEINLGFVWYRKDDAASFSLGVRQHDQHEGYRRDWITRLWPLYNAPPGTEQRMACYFYLSPDDGAKTREAVMAFTHDDRYKPLPGYKTMVTHFHTGFAVELMEKGMDFQAPWIPPMRALDVDIVYLCDFHTDGHPQDPGPIRLAEQAALYEACRRHSDTDFLIYPGEEPDAWLGGHYNILFTKPLYWTLVRGKDQPFVEDDPKYGRVYHTGSAADVLEMLKRENALVWQTHPRSKASTGYPDAIKETDYFKSDYFLGGAFKLLPVDLSVRRIGEPRNLDLLDDMNNWGRPKYIVGEVDSYKKFPDYDLYGDFNVTYLKLAELPPRDNWTSLRDVLRAGDFFVTTGEVLIPKWEARREGDKIVVAADVEWTFPLEFVEVVWGDGATTGRQIVPATDLGPMGKKRFEFTLPASGKKWVRFAAWDSAVNGAFTQPVHFEPGGVSK